MKVFQTYHRNNGDFKEVKDKDWNNVDFLAVFNFNKNKITTYGQTKGDFDITKYISNKIEDDSNAYWKLEAIDKDGEDCTIEVVIFHHSPSFHRATMTVYYLYEQIFFRLKDDD